MDTDFEWPCHRHYAHGPHTFRPYGDKPRGMVYPGSNRERECPGVKAHPNTMIGRQG